MFIGKYTKFLLSGIKFESFALEIVCGALGCLCCSALSGTDSIVVVL